MKDDPQGDVTAHSELLAMRGPVEELLEEVEDLNSRLDITDTVVKRGKRNQKLIALLLGASFVLGLGTLYTLKRTNDALDAAQASIKANEATLAAQKAQAVKGCENANESRKGQLLLWTVLFSAPSTSGDKPTPTQQQQVADFMKFVMQLYMPRDCSNLAKTYPLPEIPKSLQPTK